MSKKSKTPRAKLFVVPEPTNVPEELRNCCAPPCKNLVSVPVSTVGLVYCRLHSYWAKTTR